jgi:hypothetical protein
MSRALGGQAAIAPNLKRTSLMSAFEGKADIGMQPLPCPLLTKADMDPARLGVTNGTVPD